MPVGVLFKCHSSNNSILLTMLLSAHYHPVHFTCIVLLNVILTTALRMLISFSSFNRYGNWGHERWSNMSWVHTQHAVVEISVNCCPNREHLPFHCNPRLLCCWGVVEDNGQRSSWPREHVWPTTVQLTSAVCPFWAVLSLLMFCSVRASSGF